MNFTIARIGRLMMALVLIFTQIPVPLHAEPVEYQAKQKEDQQAISPNEVNPVQENSVPDQYNEFMESGGGLSISLKSSDLIFGPKITDEEKDEVLKNLGAVPVRKLQGDIATTGNSTRNETLYYGENDRYLGKKIETSIHLLPTDEVSEVKVTWEPGGDDTQHAAEIIEFNVSQSQEGMNFKGKIKNYDASAHRVILKVSMGQGELEGREIALNVDSDGNFTGGPENLGIGQYIGNLYVVDLNGDVIDEDRRDFSQNGWDPYESNPNPDDETQEYYDDQNNLIKEVHKNVGTLLFHYSETGLKGITVVDTKGNSIVIEFEIDGLTVSAAREIASAVRDLWNKGELKDGGVLYLTDYQNHADSMICSAGAEGGIQACTRKVSLTLMSEDTSYTYNLDVNETTAPGEKTKTSYTANLAAKVSNEEIRARRQARWMALEDLVKTTGLSREELRGLIESTDIRLEGENVIVKFKFHEGKMNEARIIELLNDDMADTVEYVIGREIKGQTKSIPPSYIYGARFIQSAHWEWKIDQYNNLTADVYYSEGRIRNIQWMSVDPGTPPCGPGENCLMYYRPGMITFLYQDIYDHSKDSIVITRGSFLISKIIPLDEMVVEESKGFDAIFGAPQHVITLKVLADGKHHITEMKEYDNYGNLTVTSAFEYMVALPKIFCAEGKICDPASPVVSLVGINRVNGNGELLSSSSIVGNVADVILMEGGEESKEKIEFKNLKHLLDQLRQLEAKGSRSRKLIFADLVNTFGFSETALRDLIAKGLIKIKIDLKGLTADVFIDPSVKLAANALNLTDPLGKNRLPKEIHYKLGRSEFLLGAPCSVSADGKVDCPPSPEPVFYLESAEFHIDNTYYQLNYIPEGIRPSNQPGDNRIHSVKVYEGDPHIVCIKAPCPTGRLVKEITYRWYEPCRGEVCLMGIWQDMADIHYYNEEGKETFRRTITFNSGGFSYLVFPELGATVPPGGILYVDDFRIDEKGNPVFRARNTFKYLMAVVDVMCVKGKPCVMPPPYYSLYQIDRTDAQGNPLSTLTSLNGSTADIKLPDGRSGELSYASLEELLRKAARFERGDFISPEKRFADAFAFLTELAAKDTITLGDAKKMREIQALLKRAVERLPKDKQEEWTKKFNEYLNQSDKIIGTKSLKVVLEDGREILVRNHSDLFTKIIQRFKMMDQNGAIDLTRLAGIGPEDLKDLETLAQYVDGRRIGKGFDLPLFDLYSPLGNLEMIDRLVRKYAAENVTKTEGPVEIIVDDFLRYIDGTKPAFDAAMRLAKEIFAKYAVHIPSSPLTVDSITAVLKEMETLNSHLSNEVAKQLGSFRGEEVFKNQLLNEVTNAIMHAPNGEVSFSNIWGQLLTIFTNADVVYKIDGKEIRVTRAELDGFTNYLPWDSSNLMRYPGVKANIDPAFFKTLVTQEYYSRLSYVDLRNPSIPAMTGAENSVNSISFSQPARRYQLLEQFLKTWPEVIKNGSVDFDRLRFRLLISYELELALGRAEEYLREKIAEMDAFGKKEAITSEDYEAMKNILRGVQKELADRFTPLLKDVIYDTTNEVTSRIQVRYQALVSSFGNVLGKAKVTVQGPDGAVVFDPRTIQTNVLDRILSASAIRVNGSFPREAYLRINGITEEMLAGLISPEALNQLRYFSFYNYYSSWQSQNFAVEEVLFKLIPSIVKNLGTSDTDKLAKNMTEGMNLLVPLGQDLEATIKNGAVQLIQDTLRQMNEINLRTLDDVTNLKAIFEKLGPQLRLLADFNQDGKFDRNDMHYLSGGEFSVIESWIAWNWSGPSVNQVNNLFHSKLSSIDFLEIGGVRVPIRQIVNIANFPNSKDFNKELFPGLETEDLEYSETSSETNYQYFRFIDPAPYPSSYLTDLGRIQAAIHAASRYIKSQDPSSKLFFTNGKGQREMDPNEFRKIIKGVYAMQQAVLEETRRQVKEAAAELEKMRKGSYTIEEIEALHNKVLELRANLVKMLEAKASLHERQDVLAIENEVSVIFQKGIFDLFVSMVGDARLVVEIGGKTVTVPAKAITDALIALLKAKIGKDSIAAHDFATLYGISVDDVRRVHKMESYLSEQMVVLPKNSEWIQIISQISELGYMELASLLVKRYANEVIVNGEVDVKRLIELVGDKDRAVKNVKDAAIRIFEGKSAQLRDIAGGEMNFDALNKMVSLMEDAKGELVSLMNDFLSGNSDNELLAELEELVNDLYGKLKTTRDEILEKTPFVYEVGGRKISLLLNKETISRFAQAVAEWLAANPGYKNPYEPYPVEPIYPIYNKQALSINALGVNALTVNSLGVNALEGDTIDFMPKIKRPGGGIWFPYPDPKNYNPGDHPTDFGFAVLMARLAVKYGEFAVDENGFNMKLFLKELESTDQSRAERRLQAILDKDLPALKDFIDSLREQGAFPVDRIKDVNEKFLALKERVRVLSDDANMKAQEVWSQFAQAYEKALFEGKLSANVGGQKVVFEPQVLNDILMKLHNAGALDPELMKKFDEMINNGETYWQYNEFRNLSYYRFWLGYDYAIGVNIALSKDETDPREVDGRLTLGELERMPGISPKDLNGLDVIEKDHRLKLTPADPLTLMGLLDMRSLAPGSGANVGGLMSGASVMAESKMSTDAMVVDRMWIPEGKSQLSWKSTRFNIFELIPAMLEKMGSDVLVNGKVVPEFFKLALQGKLSGFLAERAKALAAMDDEIARVKSEIESLESDGVTDEQLNILEEEMKKLGGDYQDVVDKIKALDLSGISADTRGLIKEFLQGSLSSEQIIQKIEQYISATRFNHSQRMIIVGINRTYLKALQEARMKNAEAQSMEEFILVKMPNFPSSAYQDPGEDPRGFFNAEIERGNKIAAIAAREHEAFVEARDKMLAEMDAEIEQAKLQIEGLEAVDPVFDQIDATEQEMKALSADYQGLVEKLKTLVTQSGVSDGTRLLIQKFIEGAMSGEQIQQRIEQFVSAVRFNHEQRMIMAGVYHTYLEALQEARMKNAEAQSVEEFILVVMPSFPDSVNQDRGEDIRGFLKTENAKAQDLAAQAEDEINKAALTHNKVTVRNQMATNRFLGAGSSPILSSAGSGYTASSNNEEEDWRKRRQKRKWLSASHS